MLSTAGKSKQTQNLTGCVTKEEGVWFQVELKLLLPSFLTLLHLPLRRAPISHCVQLTFKHSWWHNDWDKDISSSCQWHSYPETVPGTSSKSPPPHPWAPWTRGKGFITLLVDDPLSFKVTCIYTWNHIFILKCKFFGRSCLLDHVTIPVARRGDHYPEEEPDCCIWILKKTFGGGEHLQMLMKMGLEHLLWSGNRWTINCLIHYAACSKLTFWDPLIVLL